MRKHPTPKELDAFLTGKADRTVRNAVTVHLLKGCPRCRRRLGPLAAPLFAAGLTEAADDGSCYEFAIRRAVRRAVVSHARAGVTRGGRVLDLDDAPARARLRDEAQLRRCEAALDEVRTLRHGDPQELLAVAVGIVAVTEQLVPELYAEGAVLDLQARAYAELANARRVTNDFRHAEADFLRAAARAQMGTGDPLLAAELAWMASSIYRAVRRFEEAFLLLDHAFNIYRRQGETHLAGRTLINKGIAKGYHGDLTEAIALLGRGITLLERDRDPELLLAGVHSLISFQVDSGHFAEGRELVRAHRKLYRDHGKEGDHLRLRWVEGKIAAGLGEMGAAEAAFLAARAGFLRHRLLYDAALLSLDLAQFWLRENRAAEVGPLIAEMLAAFRALGIRREATAVLLLVDEAVRAERLTAVLLRTAAASLRSREKDFAR